MSERPVEEPPRLDDAPGVAPPSRPIARTPAGVLALVLLASYVLLPAVMGMQRAEGDGAVLPSHVRGVLLLCAWELTLFGAVLGVAITLGQLRAEDLWLRWRGAWTVPRALGWSLALRLGVGVFLAMSLGLWQLVSGAPADIESLRPKVESMVDVSALRDPVYLVLMLTLVSFVVAGLREELWRAGMLALLGRVLPRWFGGRLGPWIALLPVALLFGLGHTAQGPIGVAATTLLGIGLGAIMLLHRSIWDAVLAHGFFNAATFAALPLLAERLPDLLRSAGG